MLLILLVLLLLFAGGGYWGAGRGAGPWAYSPLGFLLVILIVLALAGRL